MPAPLTTLRPFPSLVKLSSNVFTPAGKLIAIEGIDGSGKRTQLELLEKSLITRGIQFHSTGFPHYESWFGKMVGRFLNGDFGALESVDPHFAALLYAGDRFEAKQQLYVPLEEGKLVLADRYIPSNLAHQTARVPPARRDEFLAWIEHLEYVIYGLPHEDLVVYLRVPPVQAQALVSKKSARSYTSAKQDIQEGSLRHLEDAAAMYDALSRRPGWAVVECFDSARNEMRAPEAIAANVLKLIEPLLTTASLSSDAAGHGGKERR
jgi:dTMP kinase